MSIVSISRSTYTLLSRHFIVYFYSNDSGDKGNVLKCISKIDFKVSCNIHIYSMNIIETD